MPGLTDRDRERDALMLQVSILMDDADQVRRLLSERYPYPHAVHVVVPDPKLRRAPWIEVMATDPTDTDLGELLDHRWPNVQFGITWVDPEDL